MVGGIETLKMVGSMVEGTKDWGYTTCSAQKVEDLVEKNEGKQSQGVKD